MVFSVFMDEIMRKVTRLVVVGGVPIGRGNPCVVQSMTTSKTSDFRKAIDEIERLTEAGSQIVRVAIADGKDAIALGDIIRLSPIPIVADVHFDFSLAVEAIKAGVHKLRINPGTLRSREKLFELASMLRSERIPVRVGCNSGSIAPQFQNLYNENPAEGLVQSALHYVEILKDKQVEDIVVSLKSSDVSTTVAAYERFSFLSDIPLHIGVTEAGPGVIGAARSTVALTLLLAKGIGDTIRVSLTGDSVAEVRVCYEILSSLGLPMAHPYPKLISCPTCGRISYDLISLIREIEPKLYRVRKDIKVAIMGCAVNGPGEAKEADIGIAGEKGRFLLFKAGKILGKNLTIEEARDMLFAEIEKL